MSSGDSAAGRGRPPDLEHRPAQERYGIACPACAYVDSHPVIDTKDNRLHSLRIRRRICRRCGHSWRTQEMPC